MTTIVKAGEKDAPLLARIGGQTIIESHGRSATPEVMNAYIGEKFTEEALTHELQDENNLFHIIYHDEQPAGYSKIILDTPNQNISLRPVTKMERLYLLQEFYSLHLGRKLMDFNIELSKGAGEAGMWLFVWKENHRALRFYTHTGFEIVGDGYFRLTDDHANPNWQMLLRY